VELDVLVERRHAVMLSLRHAVDRHDRGATRRSASVQTPGSDHVGLLSRARRTTDSAAMIAPAKATAPQNTAADIGSPSTETAATNIRMNTAWGETTPELRGPT